MELFVSSLLGMINYGLVFYCDFGIGFKSGYCFVTGLYNWTGIQAELVLGTIARKESKVGDCNGNYLDDRVSFSEDKIMDSESKAVMMAWEKPLMEAHAKAVCSGGGHILNIGFGMGLVDTAIQQYAPTSHTIVEAHPEVYERMLRTGWGEKDNVKIIFGRWQDVLPQLESYDGRSSLRSILAVVAIWNMSKNFEIVALSDMFFGSFIQGFSLTPMESIMRT